jgi:RHS repeat-associated protein
MSDALGRTIRYLYDSKGRLAAVVRPDGARKTFSYDAAGNLSALSSPMGATHGLDLDASDLDTGYEAPLSGTYRQIYDSKGRVVKVEFPSGKTISYCYEGDNLVLVRLPEGVVKLSYGRDGLTRVSMGQEAVTYRYEQGLLAVEWRLGTLERELAYGYGKNGILTSFAYSGAIERYAYDEKGRLVRAGSFIINREAENGLAISVTDSNMQLSRQYNEYGELDAKEWIVAGLPATWWSIGRDAAGRIVRKSEAAGGRVVDYAYGYDAAGRLSRVKKDGAIVEEYRYNADGARVFELNLLAGIAGRTYRYDEEGRLIAAGDMRFAYDPDGFLTRKTDKTGETKYAYASRGGLLRVDIPGGTVVKYINDPFGRRIAKKVNGNVVEKYLWQGQTRLLAVCDAWNNLLCRFVYADVRTPAAMEQGGRTFYLSYDQVGSLRQVTDSSGRAVKVLEYDSFGNIIKDSAPGFFLPIGFAGGLWDIHTGLVRFGYRDYDSKIGRWTAKDPIGFAAGDVDLFGYCNNDPVNGLDPFGTNEINDWVKSLQPATRELWNRLAPYVNAGARYEIMKLAIRHGVGSEGLSASFAVSPGILIGIGAAAALLLYLNRLGGDRKVGPDGLIYHEDERGYHFFDLGEAMQCPGLR